MVAFHFPPLAGSSGIQRTLRFVQHLPANGWEPLVLSADPRAYERTNDDLNREVPASTVVERARAWDAARHLSIGGRYLGWTARPDRWMSWRFDGVRRGLAMVGAHRPALIWSTYPIATAHLIGVALHRRTGLPWVADFRDPMAQDGYPPDPKVWRSFDRIEQLAMRHASLCVFTTPGAARMYRERYPTAADRIVVIENGYDEESFARVDAAAVAAEGPLNAGAVTLLHSGIVYPGERNPVPLFTALGALKASGRIEAAKLKLRFRAAVHDDLLQRLAREHAIEDLIETLPAVGYRDALAEMLRADALLVMQGNDCNEQIPAKIYEYLRARRPILGLADPSGDTAGVLRAAGLDAIAPLESADAIGRLLPAFIDAVRRNEASLPGDAAVEGASRRGRAEALAACFDRLIVRPSRAP
ncbi:glycosyltransferase [Schlegelella sp. ID0723]|uniref:Glycosyltransferase n=2 Tax=Piscinibacter koreensis TaxID=2742824 RepID=A0A7Y6TVL9_9BURK|nr:glycosyltransferase [Schlegelella koreensis]